MTPPPRFRCLTTRGMRAAAKTLARRGVAPRGCADPMLDNPRWTDTLDGLEKALFSRGWPFSVPSPQPGRRHGVSSPASLSSRALESEHRLFRRRRRPWIACIHAKADAGAGEAESQRRRRGSLRPKSPGSSAVLMGPGAMAEEASSRYRFDASGRRTRCPRAALQVPIGPRNVFFHPQLGPLPSMVGEKIGPVTSRNPSVRVAARRLLMQRVQALRTTRRPSEEKA